MTGYIEKFEHTSSNSATTLSSNTQRAQIFRWYLLERKKGGGREGGTKGFIRSEAPNSSISKARTEWQIKPFPFRNRTGTYQRVPFGNPFVLYCDMITGDGVKKIFSSSYQRRCFIFSYSDHHHIVLHFLKIKDIFKILRNQKTCVCVGVCMSPFFVQRSNAKR